VNKNRLFSRPVAVAALLILIAISCATIAAAYLFSLIQTDVKSRLSDTLEASISRAKNDIQTHKRNARYWSENLSLRQIMQIIEAGGTQSVEDDLYRRLDTTLTAITESENYRDYKLFNLNGELLLSGRDGVEDSPRSFNLPSSLLREARSGEVAVSQPLKSQQLWQDMDGHIREGLATMIFMAPVIDWFGETIGFFAFEINPDRLFIPAFHDNQFGSTGQTYAIDRDGLLLTESKFSSQLVAAGLLSPTHPHAELRLTVRRPDDNLLKADNPITARQYSDFPLTRMAQSLTRQASDIDIEGYRDYRGVEVIGAWRWDEELNMGIATETEVAEAYKLFRSLLYSVIFSIVVVIVMTAIGTLLYRRSTMQRMASLQQRDAIINQTDDGFVTIDDEGMINMVNPAVCSLFGYTETELVGQPVSILLPEEERSQHDHYLAHSALHAPKVIHRTRALQGRRKDGSLFPIELNVSPMQFGHRKYFIGVIRDISERHQYQQELINAMRQAEQANRAKSEFLAKMSHELRTPLNAIIGFSQLLKLEDLQADQRESVNMIESSGSHLLSLINDVLDLSRIESGHMTISVEDVALKPLIDHLLPLVEVQLTPLSLTLETDYPEDMESVFVRADYVKLKQVLLNLLSNAAKYNRPHGHIRLRVRQQNENIRIAVEDTGYGIDEEMQSRLFEPFNRLDKERSNIPGTGIGLAISHELVKLMQGRFGFDSSLDVGSTFWVEFKRASVSVHASKPEIHDAEVPHTAASHAQQTHVLCIEDNPTNLDLIKQYFSRRRDIKLSTAVDAETGLELAFEMEPDIILMDINLPGKDGFEALKQLKQSAVTRYIKVIALSANAMTNDIEKGLEAGFDRYLTKPIHFDELEQTIDSLLS
jgi:PAS domain S-box-containing protein